ncbi:hypothetical protein GQ55_3G324000 [Panicum hallii var. hallii]|uniref:Uncharacterized protein n=1 Tax=Panicum hallii var. hallii TaxID=1504633 RepID=A0A2T7EFF4_9POAL|nr:hypothetical protein GQ55_3G324000 [Panicum hallii var. hallii]
MSLHARSIVPPLDNLSRVIFSHRRLPKSTALPIAPRPTPFASPCRRVTPPPQRGAAAAKRAADPLSPRHDSCRGAAAVDPLPARSDSRSGCGATTATANARAPPCHEAAAA